MLLCAQAFIDEIIKPRNLEHSIIEAEDGSYVKIKAPWNDTNTEIYFSGTDGRDVNFLTYIEKVPDNKLEELYAVCNALNAEWKWMKFYIDSNNYLVASDDAYLSVDNVADECERLLIPRFDIIKESKPTIMRAIWA